MEPVSRVQFSLIAQIHQLSKSWLCLKSATIITMKIVKYVGIFLTALFIGIVAIERFPGVLMNTNVAHEWLMFGLFKISLLDDITHGISGFLGVIALLKGYRWTVKYLMLIGGYYSLDAIFSLCNGVFTGQTFMENFMLNAPHVGITVLVAFALYNSVQKIELK